MPFRLSVLNKPCKERPKTDQLETVWGRFLELSQASQRPGHSLPCLHTSTLRCPALRTPCFLLLVAAVHLSGSAARWQRSADSAVRGLCACRCLGSRSSCGGGSWGPTRRMFAGGTWWVRMLVNTKVQQGNLVHSMGFGLLSRGSWGLA